MSSSTMENATELAALLNIVVEQNRDMLARLDGVEKNPAMSFIKDMTKLSRWWPSYFG